MTDPHWRASASCGADPELWSSRDHYARSRARAYCLSICPTLTACRDLRDSTLRDGGSVWGVWAGVDFGVKKGTTAGSRAGRDALGEGT